MHIFLIFLQKTKSYVHCWLSCTRSILAVALHWLNKYWLYTVSLTQIPLSNILPVELWEASTKSVDFLLAENICRINTILMLCIKIAKVYVDSMQTRWKTYWTLPLSQFLSLHCTNFVYFKNFCFFISTLKHISKPVS
jgi:hypothetical protein